MQYQIKAGRNSPLRGIKKLVYIEKFSKYNETIVSREMGT